eukprot:jgi/Mesvir1/15437/Mv06621-RA.1
MLPKRALVIQLLFFLGLASTAPIVRADTVFQRLHSRVFGSGSGARDAAKDALDTKISLSFAEDGTFKLLVIGDMHYSEGVNARCRDLPPWKLKFPCSDKNTTAFLERLINTEAPNLVVFTGDNIDLTESPDANPQDALYEALAPVIQAKIPWAAVLGNHDGLTLEEKLNIAAIMQDMPLSLFERGNTSLHGVGNYIVRIRPAAPTAATVATTVALAGASGNTAPTGDDFVLFMVDSGADSEVPGIPGWDWIRPNQIAWYLDQSAALPKSLPALMFFHIPLREYGAPMMATGQVLQAANAAHINSGMYAAIKEADNVRAVFVGHDHPNDICGDHHGVKFCYAGGAGYGRSFNKVGNLRRARVVELRDHGRRVVSWKRVDDDTLSQEDVEQLYPDDETANEFYPKKRVVIPGIMHEQGGPGKLAHCDTPMGAVWMAPAKFLPMALIVLPCMVVLMLIFWSVYYRRHEAARPAKIL